MAAYQFFQSMVGFSQGGVPESLGQFVGGRPRGVLGMRRAKEKKNATGMRHARDEACHRDEARQG
eukprot:167055-Pelagomonas_calceolata.AAC.1